MPVNARIIRNIAETGSNAPLGIERELKHKHGQSGAVIGIVQYASTPFKGKVLQFLSNVPLLKDLPAVTAYVKKTQVNNQLLLTQFILALAETEEGRLVNETELLAAAETLQQMKLNRPLSGRDFKVMTDRMADFYGVGDAQKMPRRVQVNIWPYENKNHPGHTSMTINNDGAENSSTHISWWPAQSLNSSDKNDSYFRQHKVLPNENYEEDAGGQLSRRTEKKLGEFSALREMQKDSCSIGEILQKFIDAELKKTFLACREKVIKSIRDDSFRNMASVKRKDYLTAFLTKNIKHENHETESDIVNKFIEKIFPIIINIMLDEAFVMQKKRKKKKMKNYYT